MSLTIDLGDDQSVQVSEQRFESQPPDRLDFVAEGIVRPTVELLGEFEGMALEPTEVGVSIDGSETVAVDLTEGASLRLEAVDVGVETPGLDDVSSAAKSLEQVTEGNVEAPDGDAGAIAFTVEGEIRNVPEDRFDQLSGGSPTLAWITFDVQEAVRSDGGSGDDVLIEFTLLGFGVAVYRDGRIEISTRGDAADIELP